MSENAFRTLGYNVKGHYRTSVHITLPDTMAANARFFSIRNTGANLLIPTRMTLRAVQAAAGTAQLAIIAAFRCTNFTASDTVNAVTPGAMVVSVRGDMAAAPGNAELASSAAAAGMTGGTLTKDTGGAFAKMPMAVLAAATGYMWNCEAIDAVNGGRHPLVLARNEGFELESLLANTTSFGVSLVIDLSWAECVSFGQ